MIMKNTFFGNGFTLIELMTVVAIIAILCAIAVPNFVNAQIRAKVARAMAEQDVILWSLESYSVDRNAYPINLISTYSSAGDLVPLTTPVPYISTLPFDMFLHPPDMDKKDYIVNWRNNNPFYFYRNFVQETGSRINLRNYSKSGSANYVVYSWGPSYNFSFDFEDDGFANPDTWVEYEPSNGMTSFGNIAQFGP